MVAFDAMNKSILKTKLCLISPFQLVLGGLISLLGVYNKNEGLLWMSRGLTLILVGIVLALIGAIIDGVTAAAISVSMGQVPPPPVYCTVLGRGCGEGERLRVCVRRLC